MIRVSQQMKKVSIIIVNWNGKHHLEKCLASLEKQSYENVEILMVDNASTDDSVEFVKKFSNKIRIIENSKNYGFAEANNIGYRKATGDYILFLNNDTEVYKHFINELVKVLESDSTIGGVQSKILFMDNPSYLDAIGSFLTNTGFLYHYGLFAKDGSKFSSVIPVYSAKGACMLFRREVLEGVEVDNELFDSNFFAYFEETDLCHRVWLSGYKILYVPKSVILHKFGATSKRLAKPFIEYHSFKNRINSYIKNLSYLHLAYILPIHIILCEGLSLVFIFRRRFDIFVAIQRAILWNVIHLPKTIKKRNYIQNKIRKLTDKEIFKTLKKNQPVSYYLSLLGGWNISKINDKKSS